EPLYHLVRGSLAYSSFPQDDFYYYYLTAKHVATEGFSSFDGIVPTNGYHPLWLWLLSGISYLSQGSDPAFFVLLSLIQIGSSIGSAFLFLRLFRTLYGETPWVNVAALLAAIFEAVLISSGMEIALAVP